MKVVSTRAELKAIRALITGSLGLVPTMGALHEGHLALIRAARVDNDAVIASIFVNPAQFGPNEDFSAYPRTLDMDVALLEDQGVDIVFAPIPSEMYPPGFQTSVSVANVSQGLEGARRHGHFQGVATVVMKLFNLTQPAHAYFGQKDAQQLVVIRRMVTDLDLAVNVVAIPTVREADGLAMSSRNRYLTPEQRRSASVIYRSLQNAGEMYANGERSADILREAIGQFIAKEPFAELDYVSIADPQTLQEISPLIRTPALMSMVVKFGDTRLLDNCLLPIALNDRAGLTSMLGAV